MDKRIVEVDKEFYARLAEYLQPDERWSPTINSNEPCGLILYTGFHISNFKRLLFIPLNEKEGK